MIEASERHRTYIEEIVTSMFDEISQDGDPPFDCGRFLVPPNMVLLVQGGCFLGESHGLGRLEAHTCFLPGKRGQNALTEAAAAMRHVFLTTNTYEIVTKTPGCNLGAIGAARAMGFRRLFTRDGAWRKHGLTYPLMYWELDIDDWITSGQCRKEGQDFHELVGSVFPGKPHHGPDDVHDCYVGAAVCMVRAKQTEKALLFYNRWARLAGYAQLAVISESPLVIDAQEFLIEVVGGDYELKGK